MVVCAARYEPVSLLFGQKQGDFREKQREDCRKYEIGPETRHFLIAGCDGHDGPVFQTIERSLDGEDVLTLVGEQRQTPG